MLSNTIVSANYNDLTAGDITGQQGGSGWDPNSSYSQQNAGAGGQIDVAAGNLTAPASTNYALTQAGTAQHAERESGGASTVRRDFDTTMTGEVWFSFLGRVNNTGGNNGRTGVNIDGHGTGGGGYTDNRFLIRRVNATTLDSFVQDADLAKSARTQQTIGVLITETRAI